MKIYAAVLAASILSANFAYADCETDKKAFEESKKFLLENASKVSEVGAALNTSMSNDVSLDNNHLFSGTVVTLDGLSKSIKTNRDSLMKARHNYQAAGCSKVVAPGDAAPAAGDAAPAATAAPAAKP